MDAKLKEILKKAKMIDQRAKEFDTVDKTKLQSKMDEKKSLYESMGETQTVQVNQKMIQPGTENYNKKVKESKFCLLYTSPSPRDS